MGENVSKLKSWKIEFWPGQVRERNFDFDFFPDDLLIVSYHDFEFYSLKMDSGDFLNALIRRE